MTINFPSKWLFGDFGSMVLYLADSSFTFNWTWVMYGIKVDTPKLLVCNHIQSNILREFVCECVCVWISYCECHHSSTKCSSNSLSGWIWIALLHVFRSVGLFSLHRRFVTVFLHRKWRYITNKFRIRFEWFQLRANPEQMQFYSWPKSMFGILMVLLTTQRLSMWKCLRILNAPIHVDRRLTFQLNTKQEHFQVELCFISTSHSSPNTFQNHFEFDIWRKCLQNTLLHMCIIKSRRIDENIEINLRCGLDWIKKYVTCEDTQTQNSKSNVCKAMSWPTTSHITSVLEYSTWTFNCINNQRNTVQRSD